MHLIKKELIVEKIFMEESVQYIKRAFLDQDNRIFLYATNKGKDLKKIELSDLRASLDARVVKLSDSLGHHDLFGYTNEEKLEKLKYPFKILDEIEEMLRGE
ncbi:MAG: hypothetical protein WBG30_04290 [Psychrilyobacter sp.]|uniref:hypothetical protein n=1 Tax=Psychrilyobacter sp. TaxID=2586924 RepID=UPI003C74C89A